MCGPSGEPGAPNRACARMPKTSWLPNLAIGLIKRRRVRRSPRRALALGLCRCARAVRAGTAH